METSLYFLDIVTILFNNLTLLRIVSRKRSGVKNIIFTLKVKTIHKTYHFALLPAKEQEILLNKHFGCVRFVYDYFLSERKIQYQEIKRSDNYPKRAAGLIQLKKQEDTEWLREVNSQSLQTALRHLDTAFVNPYRTWTCPDGPILDRDINASINILLEGLRIIGVERSDYTDGGLNKPFEKHRPVKSEAHGSLAHG